MYMTHKWEIFVNGLLEQKIKPAKKEKINKKQC